ncbi:VOC family protein [Runella sp.]|uniref:VOC family protein n=1 Tax=Runella sp. TaxID=1960881 RepID=UPI003D10075E
MKITRLTPMLYTTDLTGTVNFYTQTLGFTCDAFQESWGWASVKLDDIQIMLSLPNAHVSFEKTIFTGSFYFTTLTVDILWEQIKDKVNVCYPIATFDYGMREFAIYDNNGYLLQFGQESSPNEGTND